MPQTATLSDALKIMSEFKVGGIPVVDEAEKLIGILTNRDLRFQYDMTKPVTEVMTRDNLITAREGLTLDEAESILQQHRIEKLPIVNQAYQLVGLITYKERIS
ncbi:hypothetical protein GCM10028807_62710 [Spirosoma daeguense]